MKRVLPLVALLVTAPTALYAGILDDAKMMANLTKCLIKNTQTVCMFRELLRSNDNKQLGAEAEVAGRSERYVLYTPSDKWHVILNDKGKDDLVLIHTSGEAMIQGEWHEGETEGYDEMARKPLLPIAEKIGAEPDKQEIDVWPFEEDGAVYLLCYTTNKETEECMISGAAAMPNGIVHLFSMLNDRDELFDEASAILLSVDIPRPAE